MDLGGSHGVPHPRGISGHAASLWTLLPSCSALGIRGSVPGQPPGPHAPILAGGPRILLVSQAGKARVWKFSPAAVCLAWPCLPGEAQCQAYPALPP